ncbi:dihydroneopterin aldolase [Vineibacter terrae]|uniref:dihydroneopterin aldolase n=1 Tax=Vineibacter terrae TaxID=2586908 RepID=UPI002E335028|nr:dihydroneopterin aldolase [Vineibacter terrae]HEX2887400.1 dihydroneopterin aldolase [Vineibacter terrae]
MADLLARHGETRRVFLRNYRVMANIGIHDFERQGPQALLINVELYLQPPQATLNDDIANTLDYDFLRQGIASLVASRHFNLQETLVHAILDLCLSRDAVVLARVSSEKPDVYPDCDAVGYEATRMR